MGHKKIRGKTLQRQTKAIYQELATTLRCSVNSSAVQWCFMLGSASLRRMASRLLTATPQYIISQKKRKMKCYDVRKGKKLENTPPKRRHFVALRGEAKSRIVARIVRVACQERLSYPDFLYVCQQARKRLGLREPQQTRTLPHLLPAGVWQRFFQVIQACGNLQHAITLKLLFYTAVRVGELVRIRVSDVDVQHCKMFTTQGKSQKDYYILFPASFRLVLKTYLHAYPQNQHRFKSQCGAPFTTRRIQQIVQTYRRQGGIDQAVHPHLFCYQMLNYLTARGLSDVHVQLISGQEGKKSLEAYQHVLLDTVEEAYQEGFNHCVLKLRLCPW